MLICKGEVGDYVDSIKDIPIARQDEVVDLYKGISQLTRIVDAHVDQFSNEEKLSLGLLNVHNQDKPHYEEVIQRFKHLGLWNESQLGLYRKNKDRLIEGNLKLVIYWAKKHNRLTMDCIQSGNDELGRAVDLYDPEDSRKAKFSTFASRRIKKGLLEPHSTALIKFPPRIIKHRAQFFELQDKYRKKGLEYDYEFLIPELKKKMSDKDLKELKESFAIVKPWQVESSEDTYSRDPGMVDPDLGEIERVKIIKNTLERVTNSILDERQKRLLMKKLTPLPDGSERSSQSIADEESKLGRKITRQRVDRIIKRSKEMLQSCSCLQELI